MISQYAGGGGATSNKVYQAKSLFDAMEKRAKQYEDFEGQLRDLKKEFKGIVNLDDEFKGEGAEAIKDFYRAQVDVVDAWLRLVKRQIAFFRGVQGKAEELNLGGNTVVHVDFLEHELFNADRRSRDIVETQKEDLQKIFDDISDIVELKVFSTEDFEKEMNHAEKKRTETIQNVNLLDSQLVTEYESSEEEERYVVALYNELIKATSRGGTVSPINFNADAYRSSEVYQLKGQEEKRTADYLDFKEKEAEARRIEKQQEELANRPWYEKTWDTICTFTGELTGYYDFLRATEGIDPVTGEKLTAAQRIAAGGMAAAGFIPVVGWAGRAFKGGKAIYETARGINAAHHALDAYKTTTKSLEMLKNTEKGMYGLLTANGMGEAVTGRDMFGNKLTDDQRKESFIQALTMLGLGGAAHYVDRLHAKNALPELKQTKGKLDPENEKIEIDDLKKRQSGAREINTQYSSDKLSNLKSFDSKLDGILENLGMTRAEFNELKLKPINSLTNTEVEKLKSVRDAVPPITKNTVIQKTIPGKDIEKYLNGSYAEVGGYVAKAEDVHDIKSYKDLIESLRLDYTDGGGNRPFPKKEGPYGIIRYKTDQPHDASIPYGEKFGGTNKDGPPCTQNGFTGSRNGKTVPEFKFEERLPPTDGSELYEVIDERERLVGIFDEVKNRFIPAVEK